MTNEELLQRYMDDDTSALEQLYEQNIGLIRRIAEKCLMNFGYLLQGVGVSKKAASHINELRRELFSEGALVFCEQIQSGTYDPSQGKLTTFLYPFIKGAMYRWLEQYKNDEIRTVSICDLTLDGEEIVTGGLGERDKSILGHSFGAYGYEKYSLDELSLKEILTMDGVIKARETALLRLQKLYNGSRLRLWVSVHRLLSAR